MFTYSTIKELIQKMENKFGCVVCDGYVENNYYVLEIPTGIIAVIIDGVERKRSSAGVRFKFLMPQ